MRTSQEYNDSAAVAKYMESALTWYMTDFERRCLELGARLLKVAGKTDAYSEEVRAEWNRQADEAIRAALSDGLPALERRIRERVQLEFAEGRLVVNRCPKCSRVLPTPKARQCLWCGHDWHEPQS